MSDVRKQKQAALIQKYNPVDDEHFMDSKWIRSADDILSFDEMFQETESNYKEYGDMVYPDTTFDDYLNAKRTRKIQIFSSNPIKPGAFVTPSRMCASNYAGGGRVFSKVVPVDDVAWIDGGEGQYAPIRESNMSKQYTFSLQALTEAVYKGVMKRLNEAVDDQFSTEELNQITNIKGRVQYCRQHLGNPIGKGSSRMVFQIDDEKVLKLAFNRRGLAQNDAEADWGAQNYDVVPKLYYNTNDGEYIIMEYTIPATQEDVKHCTGIDYPEFVEFIKYCNNIYQRTSMQVHCSMTEDRFIELIEANEGDNILNYMYHYMADFQRPWRDLAELHNLGIVHRYGDAWLVFLDTGLTDNIWDEYYKPKRW